MSVLPKVSVVVPCYNAEAFIGRAVDSVLQQKDINAEVIVIDDGSTDGSLDVIRTFGNRVVWRTGPNRGGPAARNAGLALATAEYVCFLDADDFYCGAFLKGQVTALEQSGRAYAIGPWGTGSARAGLQFRTLPAHETPKAFLIDWLRGKWLPPASILWRRSFVRDIGGWRVDVKKNQDGELVYRAALAEQAPAVSDMGYSVYWQHASPTRINNVVSDRMVLNGFDVMQELVEKLDVSYPGDQSITAALSYATHTLERFAAKNGLGTAQEQIALYRRERGYNRFEGPVLERALARVFGLRTKEVVCDYWRRSLNYGKRVVTPRPPATPV